MRTDPNSLILSEKHHVGGGVCLSRHLTVLRWIWTLNPKLLPRSSCVAVYMGLVSAAHGHPGIWTEFIGST